MALQCQVLNFSIDTTTGGYNGGSQSTPPFKGTITDDTAWVAIQSIDVSYASGVQEYRSISRFVPSIAGVDRETMVVTVDLDFQYSDASVPTNSMTGNVQVIVLADVA